MKRPYTAVGEIMGRIERAVRARLQDVGYLPDQHPARMLPIELLPVIMGDTTAETLQAWMQVERSATQTPIGIEATDQAWRLLTERDYAGLDGGRSRLTRAFSEIYVRAQIQLKRNEAAKAWEHGARAGDPLIDDNHRYRQYWQRCYYKHSEFTAVALLSVYAVPLLSIPRLVTGYGTSPVSMAALRLANRILSDPGATFPGARVPPWERRFLPSSAIALHDSSIVEHSLRTQAVTLRVQSTNVALIGAERPPGASDVSRRAVRPFNVVVDLVPIVPASMGHIGNGDLAGRIPAHGRDCIFEDTSHPDRPDVMRTSVKWAGAEVQFPIGVGALHRATFAITSLGVVITALDVDRWLDYAMRTVGRDAIGVIIDGGRASGWFPVPPGVGGIMAQQPLRVRLLVRIVTSLGLLEPPPIDYNAPSTNADVLLLQLGTDEYDALEQRDAAHDEAHPEAAVGPLAQRAIRLLLDGTLPTDFVAFRDHVDDSI